MCYDFFCLGPRCLTSFRLGPFGAFSELQLLGLAALRLPFLIFLIIRSLPSRRKPLVAWSDGAVWLVLAYSLSLLLLPLSHLCFLLSSLSSPSLSSPLPSSPLLSRLAVRLLFHALSGDVSGASCSLAWTTNRVATSEVPAPCSAQHSKTKKRINQCIFCNVVHGAVMSSY